MVKTREVEVEGPVTGSSKLAGTVSLIGASMRIPGSTSCWPTGATPASSICPGSRGLPGQVEGRTADDAACWLAQTAPAWRDAIRVVAIDMCSIYASAVRRMLPGAQIAVDLLHVVHLAVKMTGDVRRRVVRDKYGRAAGPAPQVRHQELLVRNLEHLSPAQFAKARHGHPGQRPGRAGDRRRLDRKEKLRYALNLRARGDLPQREVGLRVPAALPG
jgi:hypothetical protein